MSFQNASQPVARFKGVIGNTDTTYPSLTAILNASFQNNFVSVDGGDFGPDGKLRSLKVTYYPLNCDPVGNCSDNICSTGVKMEPKQANFTINDCTASKVFVLQLDDIRLIDDGGYSFSDHALAQINAIMPGLRRALALQIDTKLSINAGLLPDGTASRRVTFANGTNGTVNPQGQWEIERLFLDAGYQNPYILGGAAEIYTWQRSTAVGVANNGINTGALGMSNMYYDPLINAAFGDSNQHIIAFDPSVVKFVSWSENAGIFATDLKTPRDMSTLFQTSRDGSIFGTFFDQVTGLYWDFDARYESCAGGNKLGQFKFQIRLNWDLIFTPQDCQPFGTNGIFHFTACAPVQAPCPTGDAYPTPPTPETYEYTPGAIFPLYVGSLTIAGQSTNPNVNVTSVAELAAVLNANSNLTFTVSGSNIEYTGFSAISGTINGGSTAGGKDITFTAAA